PHVPRASPTRRSSDLLLLRGFLTVAQNNNSMWRFSSLFMWRGNNGHFLNSWVIIQYIFDFDGRNIFSPTYDDIFFPVDNFDSSLFIHCSHITRMKPAINNRRLCFFLIFPVAFHHAWTFN